MSSDEDWDMVAIEKLEEEKEEASPKEIKIEIGEKKEETQEIEIEKVAMEIEKKVENLDKNKLLDEEKEEDFFCLNCLIPYTKGCKIS
jgi:hypothetical protein